LENESRVRSLGKATQNVLQSRTRSCQRAVVMATQQSRVTSAASQRLDCRSCRLNVKAAIFSWFADNLESTPYSFH